MTGPQEHGDAVASHPDVLSGGAERPRRRRGRVLTAAGLTALAVVGAAVTPSVVSATRGRPSPTVGAQAAAGGGSGGGAAKAAAAPAAPDCPTSTIAAADGSGEYTVWVKADIENIVQNNGWNEAGQYWNATVQGVSAKACGLLHVPSLRVDIPKDKLVFDTTQAQVLVRTLKNPDGSFIYLYQPDALAVTISPNEDAFNEITGVNGDGRLNLTATTALHAVVRNTPQLTIPINCPLDFTTVLSTERSVLKPDGRGPNGPVQDGVPNAEPWAVQGTPLEGPFQNATALVASNTFTFPAFSTTGDCGFFGLLANPLFSGSDEDSQAYCDANTTCKTGQPAGAGQVTGTLRITEIDPDALYTNGPPATVPGTS